MKKKDARKGFRDGIPEFERRNMALKIRDEHKIPIALEAGPYFNKRIGDQFCVLKATSRVQVPQLHAKVRALLGDRIDSAESIFLFVEKQSERTHRIERSLLSSSANLEKLYETHMDSDFFLHISYCSESVFGNC